MSYVGTFRKLAEAFQEGRAAGYMDSGLVLHQRRFRSVSEEAEAGTDSFAARPPSPDALEPESLKGLLDRDDGVTENLEFPYRILAPSGGGRSSRGVLVLHGLNERRWEKYLPWAKALVEGLGVPVILFPVAFHMDRSPALWAEPRTMRQLSRERMRRIPELEASSFANAALSTRLHARPDRFVWSGLRTLRDLTRLSESIQRGEEPLLAPGARLDFFAYSIGAFLAEILLMADDGARFAGSRLVTFCGGCLLSQTVPLSREILDSAAARALHRLFENLDNEKQLRPELGRLLAEDAAGRAFELMVREDRHRSGREAALQRIGARMSAISLRGDRVMPAMAVAETLAGSGARVEILDPPYAYEHANPFPLQGTVEAEVERGFEAVFERAVAWLDG
ncbi:DUF6051 family protein [Vitiosangium sp. GDMCC 1.1324]|uniref:DUF6051 family protein n=1 Tax=Vitiosangium sp. (strain GDMCC 1.1324) TaxID=2138576 RepID=UPI000D35310E|nr:DUF6051 family protein [Vitiosangium sp. GDMCC 1.1324]PTL77972.1 hypothetical protein DAT35_40800 [Vitiosangium sp. GDMCC 1.1324]